jgi:hypothetical protein
MNVYMNKEERKKMNNHFIKQYQILDNISKNLEFDLTFYENENKEKIEKMKDDYKEIKKIKYEYLKLYSMIISKFYKI